uniref:SFRICE_028667 n=1 Tax=Spodoptera frugiperda TaxID=7108 RepID=A0A2H1WU93_SPOFR
MATLVLGEVAFCVWLALQVAAWQQSEAARQLAEALELSDHLRPLLDYMARWHPLPQRVDELIQEASEDAPRNAYVALGLGVLLPALQLLGAAAALLAARAPRAPRATARSESDAELSLQPRPPSYNRYPLP